MWLNSRTRRQFMDLAQCNKILGTPLVDKAKERLEQETEHNFHVRKGGAPKCNTWKEYIFVQNFDCLMKTTIGAIFALTFKVLDKLHIIETDDFAPTYFTVFGVAVSLLLVFQANKCYSRFWEARGHLGKISYCAFNITRQVVLYAQCDDKETKHAQAHIVLCLKAFYYLMVEQLQAETPKEVNDPELDYINVLTPEERKEIRKYNLPHPRALIMCSWITHDFNVLRKAEVISELEAVDLDQNLQQMVQGFFGATKIKNTGIPIAYTYMIKSMAVAWCWCVPVTFIDSFEWAAPFFAFIQCFCFFSISAVAEELEDPFGHDINDLPLLNMGMSIKNGMQMVIGEQEFCGFKVNNSNSQNS